MNQTWKAVVVQGPERDDMIVLDRDDGIRMTIFRSDAPEGTTKGATGTLFYFDKGEEKLGDWQFVPDYGTDEWGNLLTPEFIEARKHNRTIQLLDELKTLLDGQYSDSFKLIQAQEANCKYSDIIKKLQARITELESQKEGD